MYKRILLAIDDSPAALRAESVAIGLAAKLGARLYVLHVMEPRPAIVFFADAILGGVRTHEATRRADAQLVRVQAIAAAAGVPCQTSCVSDNRPRAAIAGAAIHQRCDLIVMGAHARRGPGDLVPGDLTRKVILDCDMPVLVCR